MLPRREWRSCRGTSINLDSVRPDPSRASGQGTLCVSKGLVGYVESIGQLIGASIPQHEWRFLLIRRLNMFSSSSPRRRGSSDFSTHATGFPPSRERQNLKLLTCLTATSIEVPVGETQAWLRLPWQKCLKTPADIRVLCQIRPKLRFTMRNRARSACKFS